MDLESLLRDLCAKAFALDAPSACLVRGEGIEAFNGPASIRQADDGGLSLRIHGRENRSLQDMAHGLATSLGQLVPPHDYWQLDLTDDRGRSWNSERFTIGTSTGYPPNGTECRAVLRELVCAQPPLRSDGAELALVVPQQVEIPSLERVLLGDCPEAGSLGRREVRTARFTLDQWRFTLTSEPDLLHVRVDTSDSEFPPRFELRVTEALQFVLGRPLPACVTVASSARSHKTTVSPQKPVDLRPRLQRPIQPDYDFTGEAHWHLFALYLKHVLHYEGELWHPLSGSVYGIQSASMLTMETEAIKLSVEVERVLGREFKHYGEPDQEQGEDVKALQAHIRTWKGNKDIRGRAISDAERYARASAPSRLRALAAAGSITHDERRSWSRLRNPSAHGGDTWACSNQERLSLHGAVLTLFNRLVFAAIGYDGPYTDYAENGWPLRTPGASETDTAD